MAKTCHTFSALHWSAASIIFPETTQKPKCRYQRLWCFTGRTLSARGELIMQLKMLSMPPLRLSYWNFMKTNFLLLISGCPLRNPNEQHDNRDRGKSKNIEWTPYESVHKKYLNLGKFVFFGKLESPKVLIGRDFGKINEGIRSYQLVIGNLFERFWEATSQFC